MKQFLLDHEDSIVVMTSMFLITVLGGILLTATGKVLEVTANEIVETTTDPDGNEIRQTNNDRKIRFFSE